MVFSDGSGHLGELLSFPGYLKCIQGSTHVAKLQFSPINLSFTAGGSQPRTRRLEGENDFSSPTVTLNNNHGHFPEFLVSLAFLNFSTT